MRRRLRLLAACLSILALALSAPSASARVHRDVKVVLVSGLYGIGVGTVLGLASFPFTQDPRSIAIGSSLGLYLGMIAGLYLVTHRYDPGNPLKMDPEPPPPWLKREEPMGARVPAPAAPIPLVMGSVRVLEF